MSQEHLHAATLGNAARVDWEVLTNVLGAGGRGSQFLDVSHLEKL